MIEAQSAHQITGALISTIRVDLESLLSVSGIKNRFENDDGFLRVVTWAPWEWTPLPADSLRLQTSLRKRVDDLAGWVGILFRKSAKQVQQDLKEQLRDVRDAVNQEDLLTTGSVSTVRDRALAGLDAILVRLDRLVASSPLGGEAILILDTSALYANPKFHEWVFEGIGQFVVMLVPAVLAEVDDHKDSHPNREVTEKARTLAAQFREYQRRGALNDGVILLRNTIRLRIWPHHPDVPNSLPFLKVGKPDDEIIASSIEIAREHAGSPVAIVTTDSLMSVRCELAMVPCLMPPEG